MTKQHDFKAALADLNEFGHDTDKYDWEDIVNFVAPHRRAIQVALRIADRLQSGEIYSMPFNTTIEVYSGAVDYLVTRVAGGWIYNYIREDKSTSVFVPYDNEFQSHVRAVD